MHDYKARYYSAVLGRFVSPDSIVPEPGSSGGFNRYAYVNSNPLKYTDPSGHAVDASCGCAIPKKDEEEGSLWDLLDFLMPDPPAAPATTPTPTATPVRPNIPPTFTSTPNPWSGGEYVSTPPAQWTQDKLSCIGSGCASPNLKETVAGMSGFGIGAVESLISLPMPPFPNVATPEVGRPYQGENPWLHFSGGRQAGNFAANFVSLDGPVDMISDEIDAVGAAVDLATDGNPSNSASIQWYTESKNPDGSVTIKGPWCDYCRTEDLMERPSPLR